ncbi:BTB/POZ domain-containing protein 6-B-like [Paramacrobiotus metropolitanus]|uniref:BTB/POZ domain-containing protein 6-B-like n=1 Tax=Paramacrobiotus metropolitanus TaxID=2943436 RepID=UPI00244651A6|nr:BTB/POZ domain-containing protein 6-B-like [Paramacrobiotus metropolitanus]
MSTSESCETVRQWQATTRGVANRVKHTLKTGERSDVQFTVGSQHGEAETFRAHKYVLSISSAVFDSMFYGSSEDSKDDKKEEFDVPDVHPDAFANMLSFVYTDAVENLSEENAYPTLYCAQKYGIPQLAEQCSVVLLRQLKLENCLTNLENAASLNAEAMIEKCLEFVDGSSAAILQSDKLNTVKQATLGLIVKRNSLNVEEIVVYKAVEKWANEYCKLHDMDPSPENLRQALGEVLHFVRFPLMSDPQLTNGPMKCGLLSRDDLWDIYQWKHAAVKPSIIFPTVPRAPLGRPIKASPGRF